VRFLTSTICICPLRSLSSSQSCASPLRIRSCFLCFCRRPSYPLLPSMAPIQVLDPFVWPRSMVTQLSLEELVNGG
jgi:hypothetical protein